MKTNYKIKEINFDKIFKTDKEIVFSKNKVSITISQSYGMYKNNKFFQLSIIVNDKTVWISNFKSKKIKFLIKNDNLFIISDELICIPISDLLMSYLAKNSIFTLKNLLNDNLDDADELILDTKELEKIIFKIQNYSDKLDKNKENDEFIDNCLLAILPTYCYSILSQKGIIAVLTISLSTILYKLFNSFLTVYNELSLDFNNSLILSIQQEYDKVIDYLKLNNFELGNDFDDIINIKYDTLLENDNIKLHVKYFKGHINNKIFYKTALYINNIEFFQFIGNKFLPIVYSNYDIYVYNDTLITLPLDYVLKIILKENPVDELNKILNYKR